VPTGANLSDLLPGLPAGDERAARAVFEQYASRLVRLAAKHLNQKLAARVGPEDIVQSVFRTFFRRNAEGEFRIDGSDQLWQLLVRITVLKVRAKARHHTADKRDAGTEQGIDPDRFDAVGREPGPAEAAELVDQIDTLLSGLPELYGRLLGLRLQGRTVTETAEELGVSRQTVHRALNLLQDRLTALTA
jgi:RNA polymerase sigma-70 factor, ECF subfamily